MSLSDSISDFLTRVRNAQVAYNKVVVVSFSKVNIAILDILRIEGYIADFNDKVLNSKKCIEVVLKYYDKLPVIKEIIRISKPGRRVYFKAKKMPKFYNGLGVHIISTSKGIMTDSQARKLGLGGEVICGVF